MDDTETFTRIGATIAARHSYPLDWMNQQFAVFLAFTPGGLLYTIQDEAR
jgi:hypothetical protein